MPQGFAARFTIIMLGLAKAMAIMTRLAAGRTPRRDRVRTDTSTSAPQPKIPNTNAWLGLELKHEAATWRLNLEALLAEPGMAELLAASPLDRRSPLLPLALPHPAPAPPLKTNLTPIADSRPICSC